MCEVEEIKLKDNAMLKARPELIDEWDFEKNNELGLNVYEVSKGSHSVVWWNCPNCNGSYDLMIKNRISGNQNCPYCSSQRVLKGHNDMWTTNPKLASMLLDKDVGYEKMEQSGAKVDWICPNCGEIIKAKIISSIRNRGLPCHVCSDTVSLPEKIMISLLRNCEIEFVPQKIFEWLPTRRYDFFLPKFNIIIETHGEQHNKEGFIRAGGKPLSEVQEIDRVKEYEAKRNGIEQYIIIDCSKSEIDFIKNSIENSALKGLIEGKVNWDVIAENSAKSLMVEAWKMWDNGMRDKKEIGEKLGVGHQAILRYLKQGELAGKCTYNLKEEKGIKRTAWKKVCQLDLKGNLIKIWDNLKDPAEQFCNSQSRLISRCCKHETNTAYGYIWLYESDYNSNNTEEIIKQKVIGRSKMVVQLNLEGEYIRTWDSIKEARVGIGSPNAKISACCRGKTEKAGGYKWKYADK